MKTTGRAHPFILTLHLSLLLIVAGGLVTRFTARTGSLTLTPGEEASVFVPEAGNDGATSDRPAALPFTLRLERFEIVNYPGSEVPADFRSTVTVLDGDRAPLTRTISMNHVLKYRGWRFFQAGYSGCSSSFTVRHDPWGTGLVYAGFTLFLMSALLSFLRKNSRMRQALRRLSAPAALKTLALPVMLVALLGGGVPARAEEPRTVPRDIAQKIGRQYIYYNGRICPLETAARDYCREAYGRTRWRNYNAVQVVTGWRLFTEDWLDVPVRVKLRERGTEPEDAKYRLIEAVAAGEGFRYVTAGDSRSEVPVLPSRAKVQAEIVYNRLARPLVPGIVGVLAGILLFILFAAGAEVPRWMKATGRGVAGLLAVYAVVTLGLRWFVAGQVPFAGSWGVMMLVALFASLTACAFSGRLTPLLPGGLLIAGFTLILCVGAGAEIVPLRPILRSPLLSIHVLCMMLSYTLLGLIALNGAMGLAAGNGRSTPAMTKAGLAGGLPTPGIRPAAERLRDVSEAMLPPAVLLLSTGIILGSVWANVSWGSYWSWDPKETWALITLLVYAVPLHGGLSPRAFHLYTLLAFACVLITWFGVNLFMGGMHSYA